MAVGCSLLHCAAFGLQFLCNNLILYMQPPHRLTLTQPTAPLPVPCICRVYCTSTCTLPLHSLFHLHLYPKSKQLTAPPHIPYTHTDCRTSTITLHLPSLQLFTLHLHSLLITFTCTLHLPSLLNLHLHNQLNLHLHITPSQLTKPPPVPSICTAYCTSSSDLLNVSYITYSVHVKFSWLV